MRLDLHYAPTSQAVALPPRRDVEQALLEFLPTGATPAIGDLTWPTSEAPGTF